MLDLRLIGIGARVHIGIELFHGPDHHAIGHDGDFLNIDLGIIHLAEAADPQAGGGIGSGFAGDGAVFENARELGRFIRDDAVGIAGFKSDLPEKIILYHQSFHLLCFIGNRMGRMGQK